MLPRYGTLHTKHDSFSGRSVKRRLLRQDDVITETKVDLVGQDVVQERWGFEET